MKGGGARAFIVTKPGDDLEAFGAAVKFETTNSTMAIPVESVDRIAIFKQINFDAIRLIQGDYDSDHFSLSLNIARVYDTLSALYLDSPISRAGWEGISNALDLDLGIYYGNGGNFKPTQMPPKDYTHQVNILIGCTTSGSAAKLNKAMEGTGKCFIGFDDYIHMYGNTLYKCLDTLVVDPAEFKDRMRQLDGTPPVLKIVKFFHEKLQHCANCRDCSVMTLQAIEENINILKPKINAMVKLSNSESSFKPNAYTKCSIPDACGTDPAFEEYIQQLCDEFQRRIAEDRLRAASALEEDARLFPEKEAKRLEEEAREAREEARRAIREAEEEKWKEKKTQLIKNLPLGKTDITDQFMDYIPKRNLFHLFSTSEPVVKDGYIHDDVLKYKLYINKFATYYSYEVVNDEEGEIKYDSSYNREEEEEEEDQEDPYE
jgi:hypothetical protein